ncbi:Assimilatory nitrate reductase large subunit [Rubrivivax sp. A210]|uniref:nitrate reductase n=1 Tax=Rubrivivax sp. A210 TaxID=2772301 RepID=UPI0019183567|nr:nitrate reductase [Rubrivivax sp. A210]CAD5370561.1 Assimilatory nitrate reductase large subunit [Rubrivivax sp. A210]
MAETRSTCPYCGVGCGVVIEHESGQISGVRGDPEHPANFGRLCTKGQTLHLTAAAGITRQVRALQPLRRATRGGELQPVGWDAALDEVASRFATTIQQHGPDAVGLYLSGQLLTEDYYVFNKLTKGLIGTNNVDTNSRLCMSSAVAGYKQSLGADAPPACYEDLALAQTVFITGSNMAWAHPVLFRRLEDARRANPAQRLIVVDPRRTETAAVADLHLQLLPGTDVVLHHALLHLMLWEGLVDADYIAAHTSGFPALRDRVREISPAQAAKTCGLKEADIVQAARWFAGLAADGSRRPTLSLYCQGLNQSTSGTDKNSSLINLHLATGQIGRAGAGPFSLTGQPNAMGGREVGGLANQLSAHRDLADPAHRAEVAALWGVSQVPAAPGLSAVEMFEAAADGRIKALWIACTNPAQSLPDQNLVRRALQRCEFVVVQEAYAHTATAACADLLLPASSWGEKAGTVTNSERRISRVYAAVPAPGQARDDWRIAVDVARRLEALLPPRRADGTSLFPYETPESIWMEHRESTRGRDLDITGLSYAALENPQQWPCPQGASAGRARLYEDGRFATPDGRARFVAPAWRPVAEPRDARYPIALNTGRLRDQWHGMSRTGTLGRLYAHASEPALELHPQELARRHWAAGDLVRVSSRRGQLVLPVQASEAVMPAQAFIAMHWGPEAMAGLGVNALTTSAYCPQSMQPELKHAAVRLEPAALPWQVVAAAWLPADAALMLRETLRARFAAWGYASCLPFGREPDGRIGLLFRAAAAAPLPAELPPLEAVLGLGDGRVLRYADARAGQHRAMRLHDDGTLQAFVLAGDAAAQAWVLALLQQGQPAAAFGRALLAASRTPPLPVAARSRQVCACHDVDEDRIAATLKLCEGDEAARLQSLQGQLKCGTSCGSCLPTLKTLLRQHPRTAIPA